MRTVSHDPTLSVTVELAAGGSCTAIELQWEFLRLAQKYADETGLEQCGGDVGHLVLARWEDTLTALERDPMSLDGQLDWVTKLSLLEAYRDRYAAWDDPKLALLDLQYHDVRQERSLYERLVRAGKVERLVSEQDVERGMTEPPDRTRAYFRGQCLARAGRPRRRRQLGQFDPRCRNGPLAADPDDGTAQGKPSPRRGVVRTVLDPRPAGRATGFLGSREVRMPEREQKKKPAPKEREEEVVEEAAARTSGRGAQEELDDLLDEIDSVLEANAEEFVRSYVQKGGE